MNPVSKIADRRVPLFLRRCFALISRKQTGVLLLESMVAGCQYHRAEGVWPFLQVGEMLRLQREPYNRHDENAIAVYFKNDRLGYVPSRENYQLAKMMDAGKQPRAYISQLLWDLEPWRGIKFSVFLGTKGCV